MPLMLVVQGVLADRNNIASTDAELRAVPRQVPYGRRDECLDPSPPPAYDDPAGMSPRMRSEDAPARVQTSALAALLVLLPLAGCTAPESAPVGIAAVPTATIAAAPTVGVQSGVAALLAAAAAGDIAALTTQLAAGVRIDARDPEGWTALMLAAGNGRREALQALAGGVEANLAEPPDAAAPSHAA